MGETISDGIQSFAHATAEAERGRNVHTADAERANAASGPKQASFETYAIFQSEQHNGAVAENDPSGGDDGTMGASAGPMGAYATLGKDGSELQRRPVHRSEFLSTSCFQCLVCHLPKDVACCR